MEVSEVKHKTKLVCINKDGKVKELNYNEPFIFIVESSEEFHRIHKYGRIYNYPYLKFSIETGIITDTRNVASFNWYGCKFVTLDKYKQQNK